MKKLLITTTLFLLIFIGCIQNDSNCTEPNANDILNEVQLLVDNDEKVLIFNENILGTLDTIELFPGNFSGKNREYIGMCYSYEEYYPCMSFPHLSPPYETANYLLLKLSCKRGKWNIDWAAQENKLEERNIIDIEGDGINEIIFQGDYDCNGGMIYGYYYIAKFLNNELVYLYEKEPIDKIALLPNPNLMLTENDTLIFDLKVDLIDTNNDGVEELIENKRIVVYKGGETKSEILDNALITINADTLYFKNNKFDNKK